jgi:catechol 2,3-dioxygenase-like lactoylglutathione lyase family enzyme
MTNASLRFLYIFCNDVAGMRHFYSYILGLEEVFYAPGKEGGLAYNCDGLQFTIFPAPNPSPVSTEWHIQPGWQGGVLPAPSWSIVSQSSEAFTAALVRIAEAGIPTYFESPQWLGYWSFPVKDPMGNTVELNLPMDEEPQEKTWRN